MDYKLKALQSHFTLIAILMCPCLSFADMRLNIGFIQSNPDSGTTNIDIPDLPGNGFGVKSDIKPGGSLEYSLNSNTVMEIGFSFPFEHNIAGEKGLTGVPVGTIKVLPAVVIFQYQFLTEHHKLRPFVGAGINYSFIFEEKTDPSLNAAIASATAQPDADISLEAENALGIITQAGVNIGINKKFDLHFAVAKIKLNTDIEITNFGIPIGSAAPNLDPFLVMLSLRYDI